MASIPSLSFLLCLIRTRKSCNHKSCARVFSDTPSPSLAFEADLAARLQQLTHEGDNKSPSDLLSFTWMCKALDVVLSAQSSALEALSMPTSSGATHFNTGASSMTMEQYREDTIKMLDVCCLVKKSMAGVNTYVRVSHLALKRIQGLKLTKQGDVQRAKHALLSARHHVQTDVKSRSQILSACSSMLRRVGDKITSTLVPSDPLCLQDPSTAIMDVLSSTLYGGEMCTIFFLRLLSTALSSPASRKPMTPLCLSSRQAAWAPSLLALQAQLSSELLLQITAHKKSPKGVALFPELRILEAATKQIYEALQLERASSKQQADLKLLVDSTSMLTKHLQSSMAKLENQVECLFSSLVNIRMALVR